MVYQIDYQSISLLKEERKMKKKGDGITVIYVGKCALHAGTCEHYSQYFLLFSLHVLIQTLLHQG